MNTSVLHQPASVSKPVGVGPIHVDQGIAFRVWAPHADSVSVVGSFNDWNENANPMEREDGGHWFALVENAKIGSQYKYRIQNGNNVFDRIDPRVREVTNSVGVGIVHDPHFDWQGDDFHISSWNELVIYEAHIGTFSRSKEDQPGGFSNFAKRFGHLRKLGVNAIQIMPIAEFAGDVSWGYNPAHIYAVESAYGGPVAFKEFVRQAHAEGFAIILDVVYNHFGPSDLDIWQFDGWNENGKGGIYFYNDHRSSTPWGDTRPDYGRHEVRSYIRDNAAMWLEDFHVDGLRYDMTLYIRSIDGSPDNEIPEGWGLTQWVNRDIHSIKPGAITIAEDLQNNSYLTKSDHEGGAGFSTQWDAGFVHPIREVLTAANDEHRSMAKVRDALYHGYNGDAFQRVVYTESHDEVANGKSRVPSEVSPWDDGSWYAQKRSTLGAALVMTAPGIPMLFQGQEFLQGGWFQDTDELDWENAKDFRGIVRLFADLIRLRLNREGVTRGLTGQGLHVYHVNEVDKVIAYRRHFDDDPRNDVIVVANFMAESKETYRIGFPQPGSWVLRFNSDSDIYSSDFTNVESYDAEATDDPCDGLDYSAEVTIPPYSVLIYSRSEAEPGDTTL
ncbi:1,4-alpha-glucan branching enzyme GlgB [Rubripirellula amarantea]|uniref:1,4-alpha-glucan branching enzyme n=1 Tax=Rubripirellula amarantea TaxID=2527999 RepID=A0A5C5WUC2_9BACT|nr:alpha-amylase family glycosyl hydrolase [Rubripirellula amarantea]TWT53829.1 1,4-alpha-glucan branching enzyme GlgB [Rubripirellula amarantea]